MVKTAQIAKNSVVLAAAYFVKRSVRIKLYKIVSSSISMLPQISKRHYDCAFKILIKKVKKYSTDNVLQIF